MRQRERQTGQEMKRKRFLKVHGLRAETKTRQVVMRYKDKQEKDKEKKEKERLDKIDRNMGMNQEEIRFKNKQKRLKLTTIPLPTEPVYLSSI